MRRIAELNHHIRNALRVIVHHNVPKRSERAIQQVNGHRAKLLAIGFQKRENQL
jgi:hypothetical protein